MNILHWWDRQSPIGALAIVLGVFGLAALIAAVGRVPQTTPATSYIYVLSTPQPTAPTTVMPTADMRLAEENAALRARVAELEAQNNLTREQVISPEAQSVYQVMAQPAQPTPAPGPGYTAHTTEGEVFVPDSATKVPADQPYDGPFLAPVVPTPIGPRVCKTFGGDPNDWRAFDAAYETSPACEK